MERVQGTQEYVLGDGSRKKYHKQWYINNRDEVLKKQKEYYKENRDKRLAYHKKWYEKNKDRVMEQAKRRKLMQNYGLTKDDYAALVNLQEGRCAVCGKNEGWRGQLVVDHCHVTGVVRGLLCDRCNTVLGQCDDSPELFVSLAEYVGGADE